MPEEHDIGSALVARLAFGVEGWVGRDLLAQQVHQPREGRGEESLTSGPLARPALLSVPSHTGERTSGGHACSPGRSACPLTGRLPVTRRRSPSKTPSATTFRPTSSRARSQDYPALIA